MELDLLDELLSAARDFDVADALAIVGVRLVSELVEHLELIGLAEGLEVAEVNAFHEEVIVVPHLVLGAPRRGGGEEAGGRALGEARLARVGRFRGLEIGRGPRSVGL